MDYRFLGRSGLRVSELCLGGMTFHADADEDCSRRLLDRFAEAGGTFIDTADVYAQGRSEEIIGRWLKGRDRDSMVIATKVCGRTGDGPNDGGLGRKHITAAVEGSLRRLDTDYIDLYQCHTWDPATPVEETLSTFDDLVRSGKVRFLGTSNLPAWRLQKEIEVGRRYGWEPFVCLQPLYNLLDRGLDHLGLMDVCRNEGIGVVPWSPLAGGWLSGKYHRGMTAPPPGTRIEKAGQPGGFYGYAKWENYAIEHTWAIIDVLLTAAAEVGRSPAQVALRWLLQREGVTAPIIGARNLEQLEDNLGAIGWSLGQEHLERLTSVSQVRLASRVEG